LQTWEICLEWASGSWTRREGGKMEISSEWGVWSCYRNLLCGPVWAVVGSGNLLGRPQQ